MRKGLYTYRNRVGGDTTVEVQEVEVLGSMSKIKMIAAYYGNGSRMTGPAHDVLFKMWHLGLVPTNQVKWNP